MCVKKGELIMLYTYKNMFNADYTKKNANKKTKKKQMLMTVLSGSKGSYQNPAFVITCTI